MTKKPVIGLLGGGQLGRMLCEAAGPLGIEIAVLDAENCPAKQANQNSLHLTGSFKDPEKIKALAARSDVLTVEIEHVETEILEEIATKGIEVPASDGQGTTMKKVPVHPSWKTIRLIQDKFQQKEYFSKNGIPVAQQMAIEPGESRLSSLEEAGRKFGFPFMLKGSKGSYDGRGNFKVTGAVDFPKVSEQMGEQPLYAEKWVPFVLELSAMVIRTEDDEGKFKGVYPYPIVETIHEDSICTKVFYPPRGVAEKVARRAQKVASDVVASLWGRGVFAVEMFLLADDQIMVNEVAPRPHNSGHYTIEAVPQMSQYKAQLYSILDRIPSERGIRLTPRVSSAIMLNILGGANPTSHDRFVELADNVNDDYTDIYVHLYGKESKPGRKIGHVTATGFSSIDRLSTTVSPLIRCMDEIRLDRIGGGRPPTSSSSSTKASTASQTIAQLQQPLKKPLPLVAVTMGSDSDLGVMSAGLKILDEFNVPYEVRITSAHRTPKLMMQFAEEKAAAGCKVIIAGAGGAAHLPGMLASEVHIPVIGVPVRASQLDGLDSLLSIVQMPRGVPCATVGVNNSTNAALLAVRILGAAFPEYADRVRRHQHRMEAEVIAKDADIVENGWSKYVEGMQKK